MSNQLPIIEADGIAVIGDVHLWSGKPGRRNDDYAATVLTELRAALKIAADRNLVPLLLGDLFHTPVEIDEALKGAVMELLGEQPITPFANVGNHDIAGAYLSASDSLSLLRSSGKLRVLTHGGGAAIIRTPACDIGVGFTPYGMPIPDAVDHVFPADIAAVVWCTHHDMAFGGAYPGALDLKPIHGAAIVFNGHMHIAREPVTVGATTWCNPGSLTRVSVDEAAHEPHVWTFGHVTDYQIVPEPIEFKRDVFDLTGRLVAAGELVDIAGKDARASEFAAALADDDFDPAATDDRVLLSEVIQKKFETENTRDEVRSAVMALFNSARE